MLTESDIDLIEDDLLACIVEHGADDNLDTPEKLDEYLSDFEMRFRRTFR